MICLDMESARRLALYVMELDEFITDYNALCKGAKEEE